MAHRRPATSLNGTAVPLGTLLVPSAKSQTAFPPGAVFTVCAPLVGAAARAPVDFGVYDRRQGNPTAAYTEGGRSGHVTLAGGPACVVLRWDRDMQVPHPDDLRMVHVRMVATASVAAAAAAAAGVGAGAGADGDAVAAAAVNDAAKQPHGWVLLDALDVLDAPDTAATAHGRIVEAQAALVEERRQSVASKERYLDDVQRRFERERALLAERLERLRREHEADLEEAHQTLEKERARLAHEDARLRELQQQQQQQQQQQGEQKSRAGPASD